MRCLDAADIARLATTGEPDPHLETCLPCRRRLADDRAMRDALRSLPVPRLAGPRRAALAAEIIAIAQHRPPQRRSWPLLLAGGTAAAALAAAFALLVRGPHLDAIEVTQVPTDEPVRVSSALVEHDDPAAALGPPRIAASGGARISHRVGEDRDLVAFSDGTVEIDSRAARDVDVVVGDTRVRIADASVVVQARARAIVSVRVVAGAVRVASPSEQLTLQHDSVWLPEPASKPSVTAFREAWIAEREGRHRDAIALFDRVTDPVAVEEARYWAAVAAQRAGDRAEAARRFAAFAHDFPSSPYNAAP